jgi:hypothetical protein
MMKEEIVIIKIGAIIANTTIKAHTDKVVLISLKICSMDFRSFSKIPTIGLDEKILALYAQLASIRDISAQFEKLYQVSAALISEFTAWFVQSDVVELV